MSPTAIAEIYLSMLGDNDPHERLYVRLAYKYGVPFGRIVATSGIAAATVAMHLEGDD